LQLAPPVALHVPWQLPLHDAELLFVQPPVHFPLHVPPLNFPVQAAEQEPLAFAVHCPAHLPAQFPSAVPPVAALPSQVP